VARSLAAAVLGPAAELDPGRVAAAFRERNAGRPAGEYASGDDLVLLAALACRRAGGEPWRAFRAEARYLLGNQPLSGGLVVLVNRLPRTDLALVEGR
jgi:hypothetical protein